MSIELRAWVYTAEQLEAALESPAVSAVYAPMKLVRDEHKEHTERMILLPPEYLADCEKETEEKLIGLKERGFENALAHTVGHIGLLQRNGFIIHGGNRLNCTNSVTIDFFAEQGLRSMIVSPELTVQRINALKKPMPTGFIAYGKLPLMLTRRCPIKDGKPCGKPNCGRKLKDRKGNEVDVICSDNTVELLNSDTLILSDRLNDFTADFAVLRFTVERDILPIIEMYSGHSKPDVPKLTRGLYYRGVE